MGKSLLYRWFGAGSVPEAREAELQSEGIVVRDEGLRGSLRFRKFRSPGRYYGGRISSTVVSVVLTRRRVVVFTNFPSFSPIVDVALDDARAAALEWSEPKAGVVAVAFDAGAFRPEWSGRVACRFRTEKAAELLRRVRSAGS